MRNGSINYSDSLKNTVVIITLGSFVYISGYGAYKLHKYADIFQVYIFLGVAFALSCLAMVSIYLYNRRNQEILGGSPDFIKDILEGILKPNYSSDNYPLDKNYGIYDSALRVRESIENSFNNSSVELESISRVIDGLDYIKSKVMITDADLNIIYVNASLKEMFNDVKDDIRKAIQSFDPQNLLGQSIDKFHTNKNHQRSLLLGLKKIHRDHIKVGNIIIGYIAYPIIDESDNFDGVVMEWENKTQQVAIENEIQKIVECSLDGDLSKRIDLENKDGFYQKISYSINDLLSVNQLVIDETSRVLMGLSKGNLNDEISFDYKGSYEQLRGHANSSIEKLRSVITNVKRSAEEVQNGAKEISQGNINLSNRTEKQAMSLEQTAAALEQMTGTVRQNSDNANEANQLASSTSSQAENSGDIVDNAIKAMAEIKVASNKISDIISVIDEIAFQTNLLALNAAVEAAHAGEQGKGFAVVASEVRSLAQRSAEAAKEIKDLIEDSVGKVNSGTELVNESGKALDEIVQSVKKVSDIIAEIATANQEQSTGIEQVNKSVLQMDESTQQNAAMVEQVAAASEALDEQSRELNQMIGFFSLAASGGEGTHSTKLNIVAAKAKHLSWKTRIRSFLDGKESLSMDQAISHRDCDLGKWIYSEGMVHLSGSSTFEALEKCHEGLHTNIRKIIALKDRGDDAQAENYYKHIESSSGKVIGYLGVIEKELNFHDMDKKQPVLSNY
jgi:methyl-accepting chemotaxis protein